MDLVRARETLLSIREQLEWFLFGIRPAINLALVALVTRVKYSTREGKAYGAGHMFFNDVPGQGKSDLLSKLAVSISAKYTRENGTPDLRPSDLLGFHMYDRVNNRYHWIDGKLATNIFFFDEISRATPKTQSASLSAMEERELIETHIDSEKGAVVSVPRLLYPVDGDPRNRLFFWMIAAQNPIEQEGTYLLPEAQLDRFTYSAVIGYPDRMEEKRLLREPMMDKRIERCVSLSDILDVAELSLEAIELTDSAEEYAERLVENSRPGCERKYAHDPALLGLVDRYVAVGMSTRSMFHFLAAARAYAFTELLGLWQADDTKFDQSRLHNDKPYKITVEHIQTIVPHVMGHRLFLVAGAEGAGDSRT